MMSNKPKKDLSLEQRKTDVDLWAIALISFVVLGITLGYHEKFPDGTFMHAALLKDGQEIFAVSESHNDAFVDVMLASSLKASRPTMSYGINFDSEDEVKRAYEMLKKDGTVLLPMRLKTRKR
ncbi:hypothetical protein [Paenibacillus sanguinis]|uniref:hypothetical protein n=1 Tax=Paenibacillus sanguinis TaxID=225906 RepID=UPI000372581B|nr:hypothetical protein [Paenibacillus sanguinis]